MASEVSDANILSFWSWFASISDRLGEGFEDQHLLHELDARVSKLGDVTWELGPGSRAECALAISPDGDPGSLPLTQRIVSMAPQLPRWELLPARPAREQALEFSIRTGASRDELVIDARSWRYVLLGFPDNTHDLVLEQSTLLQATEDDRYTAAIVLLDGLLGEATRMALIRDVEPVVALSPTLNERASSVTVLAAHLQSLGQNTNVPCFDSFRLSWGVSRYPS